jgi:hypothetical protein
LPPRDPQKKGKVERLMPFIRRLCEAYVDFVSIEHMQDYLNKRVSIANERKHGTILKKPFEVFIEEESPALKKLPPLSYVIEEFSDGKGREDGHIRFSNKYYSIGTQYHGKKIFIIANESMVSFYYQGKLIEVHERIDNNPRYKSTKKHHKREWEQISEAHEFYINRAEKIGINCKTIVSIILSLGNGFVDTRIVWGILSLDKKYSKSDIDLACEKSLKIKSYSYRAVLAFITNPNCERKNPLRLKNSEHEFTRQSEEYQKLLN